MTSTDNPTARRNLSRGDWALILLLAAINFTHILDFVIIMPLAERVMQSLQLNAQQFGFVVSAYGFAATVSGILAVFVADRFDRRTVLLASYAGFIVATFFCGMANTFGLLLFARVLAGAFGGLAASSIMAVIGDTIPDQFRGKAIGAVTSSFAVASVLGLPIGLYLAERFDSYGIPFLVIAGVSVAVWTVTWFRLPSVNRHLVHRTGSSAAAFAAVLRQPNHLRSFAFMFAMVLGTFTIIPFLAAHLQINCARSRMDVPWIYAIAGVCTLVGMNLVGWLTDKYGKRPVFLTTAIGTIIMTVAITHLTSASFGTAAVAASLFMVLASGRVVPAQGMMLASADPKMRGAFTTLNSAASHLATSIGPIVAGLVLHTETVKNANGLEEIVRLDRYDQAGWIAVGFAVIAIGLSFTLRPFKSNKTAAPVVQPVPTTNPVPSDSPVLAT